MEQYESLLHIVEKEIDGFNSVEIRCLYALITGDLWDPSAEAWNDWRHEIHNSLKRNWIIERHDNSYVVNDSHPRYKSAIKAIGNLGDFIDEMDENLRDLIEEKEKYNVDIENLEYWSRAIWGRELLE